MITRACACTAVLAAALSVGVPVAGADEAAAWGPIRLLDAVGDGDGPGTYERPRGRGFPPGSFDVVHVELRPAGPDVEMEIKLAGKLPVARHARLGRDTWGDYLLLQVDLYIDQDREPGVGETRTVPGRRVLIDERDAWERAIVVTALPGRVAAGIQQAVPALATRVHVAAPLRMGLKTVFVRLPLSAFGGQPSPDWGYTVLVTSVTLSSSLRGLVLGRGDDANVYTREVTPVRGSCENWEEGPDGRPCTFGGCEPCEAHPRVLDAIVGGPEGSREQLARYGARRWAVLRSKVPAEAGLAAAPGAASDATPRYPGLDTPAPVPLNQAVPCAGGGRFPVTDADGDVVTAVAPERAMLDGVDPGLIGELLDEKGERMGRGVVVARRGTVLVLSRIEDSGTSGARPAAVSFRCREE